MGSAWAGPIFLSSKTTSRSTICRGFCAICIRLTDPNGTSKTGARSFRAFVQLALFRQFHLLREFVGQPDRTQHSVVQGRLWSSRDFVIYYRNGRVPQPGIVILGTVTGDVSIFDRPGAITVNVEVVK